MRFVTLVEFSWRCPQCNQVNRSKRPSGENYLSVRCAKCHDYVRLGYDRRTDAPPAALALDGVYLGDSRSQPIVPLRAGRKS